MFNKEKNVFPLIVLSLIIFFLIYCLNCNDEQNNDNVKEPYVNTNNIDNSIQNIIKDDTSKSLLANTISNKVVNDELKNNDLVNSILNNTSNIQETGATIDVMDNLVIQDSNKESTNVPVGVSVNHMYAGIDDTIMNVDVGAFFNEKGALVSSDLLPSKEVNEFSQFNIETPYLDANLAYGGYVKNGNDSVGNSKRFATHDLRGPIPCPKFVVSPWNNSTAEPDLNLRRFNM
jgi:hypothetical protein